MTSFVVSAIRASVNLTSDPNTTIADNSTRMIGVGRSDADRAGKNFAARDPELVPACGHTPRGARDMTDELRQFASEFPYDLTDGPRRSERRTL